MIIDVKIQKRDGTKRGYKGKIGNIDDLNYVQAIKKLIINNHM